jgi:hypothetical protein
LFGQPINSTCVLDEPITHDIPQISGAENVILTADFTEKEVFDVVSQMENNKVPGPDGFYQGFFGKL